MSQARSVAVRLSAEVSGYISSMRQAGAETKKALGDASKYASDHSRALDDLGGTAGKVGLAAATGLGLVTKAAMDWESAWAGVEKTVDGNAVQMAALEGELRGLAKTLPATHAEIAGVAEAAGQLGVEREAIAGFTRTMVDLGETTNLSAEEAATSIAQMQNVLGTAPADIDNLGAALVALGNDGASTEAQILGMAQRIAGAGAQIGLAESDILAIANAAASMGIEVEAGGSAISRVFTNMAKATAQGGEELTLFAQAAGMSADEFATAFRDDPAQAFAAFTTGLDQINKSGGDVFTTLENLGMSDVRVSQALLGMAASGDLLTDSLALGEEAWEANTALALEAAKRYDTTAAQVQIAWNNIKDAAIEFGDAALPIVESVANGVAGLADTIGGLPGPVKSAGTSLLGITAVLGGGAWFTTKSIGLINSTKDSLASLGVVGGKTAANVDGVSKSSGKAARALRGLGIASLVFAGATVIDDFVTAVDEAPPGIEAMTQAILDMQGAMASGELPGEVDKVRESFDRLLNPEWNESTDDWLRDKIPGFGDAKEVKEAEAVIESLDQTLAGLVATGNTEVASDFIDWLGLDQAALDRMPQYDAALIAIENDAKLAAYGNNELADSAANAGREAIAQADALRDAADAMREARSEALRANNAELNYEEALLDVRKAARESTGVLQKNGEAKKGMAREAIEAKRELNNLAASWNDQSEAAKNVPGAYRGAMRAFVDAAVKMGYSREQARLLAREILEVPNRKVKVDVDTAGARATVYSFNAMLNSIDTNRVIQFRVTTTGQVPANFTGSMTAVAHGGEIPGRSPHKRADNIPVMATAGEYMHQVDAVNYYGLSVMDALNQRRIPKASLAGYAYGGHISTSAAPQYLAAGGNVDRITAKDLRAFNLDGAMGLSEIRSALADFRREVRAAGRTWTKAMDRAAREAVRTARSYEQASARLERLKDSRSSLVEGTSGVFDNDPFGNGLAQAMTQLSADANDSARLEQLLRRAKRLGLSGAAFQAIAQSGDLGTLGELDTKAEARALNQAFTRRDRAQASVGRYAGDAAFGGLIRQQTRVMTRLDKKLDRWEATTERGIAKGMVSRDRRAAGRRRVGR